MVVSQAKVKQKGRIVLYLFGKKESPAVEEGESQ